MSLVLQAILPQEAPAAAEVELVNACISGDRLAQAKLYKKHYGVMMAVCMRYVNHKEEALEVLNSGFLKVFTHLHEWKGGSLQGWIRSIMMRTALDRLRQHMRYQEHQMPEALEVSLPSDLTDKLHADDLLSMIASLPNEQRMVFNLYAIEGYKHREIAEQLGISEGTSRWYLSEARKNLQWQIQQTNYLK